MNIDVSTFSTTAPLAQETIALIEPLIEQRTFKLAFISHS